MALVATLVTLATPAVVGLSQGGDYLTDRRRTITVKSTAYCLQGVMANGTRVRAGSVAMNILPLGTRISVNRSPTGNQSFVVRDRIGWGTQLDFWLPSCQAAHRWGRRMVRVTYTS